jgi:hypothetical protein
LSMAMDDDHFVGTFEVKGETGRSWFVGHEAFSVRNRRLAESGSEKFLIRRLGWRGNPEESQAGYSRCIRNDDTTFGEPLQ